MSFWHDIPKPIIGLSPMDGVTDASYRWIAARHGGPDITVTEFTNVEVAIHAPPALMRDFDYCEIERPIIAQIYGHTPELFYKVAHIVCEMGFDGLDINMGCPAKNVAASGSGAALIRTPELARDIVRAARRGIEDWCAGQGLAEIGLRPGLLQRIRGANLERSGWITPPLRNPIPLSVKTRIGFDEIVVEDWIGNLLAENPVAISIHGRTLKQGYKGDADWEAIGRAVELAKATPTLILGNGDVKDMADVYRRVRQYGVDGVLLGRAAQGYPWIFRDKQAVKLALASGEPPPAETPVTLAERFAVMEEHSVHYEARTQIRSFVGMRKHLVWYCRDFRGAAEMRSRMIHTSSAANVIEHLRSFELGSGTPAEFSPASFCAESPA